ncbi:hypothetical protein [Nonomuraea basaltis]|uniref:hypothetical protein n=1 Tax=Nonomuraea basaltis TaxID=2495887 RepID=UPI00110C474D|nr:hypothetical protein [Nonomuraea basaltis]TMS00126.1 hypothetical protein EJK15_03380 [Nonomuraea basaltis]
MADLIRNVLTGVGGLVVLAAVVFAALWARTRRREAPKPLPNSDLPAIPPNDYQALWNDFDAWERGERP